MKRFYWILAYLIVLVCDGVFITMNDDSLRIFSKPLLMLVLLAMSTSLTPRGYPLPKALLQGALFCSFLGDSLLLFESRSSNYFIMGLAAFLAAHILYSVALADLRVKKNLRFRPVSVVPVLAFYLCLISLLYEHLGALRIPVLVYGAVISIMLGMALQLVKLKNRRSAALLFGGAVLFVASDSVLALSKFYWKENSVPISLVIMGTYGLAQLFLCLGIMNHIPAPRAPRKSAEAIRQELLN